jgi:hypothetical protein
MGIAKRSDEQVAFLSLSDLRRSQIHELPSCPNVTRGLPFAFTQQETLCIEDSAREHNITTNPLPY